jgi:hypothetical protein
MSHSREELSLRRKLSNDRFEILRNSACLLHTATQISAQRLLPFARLHHPGSEKEQIASFTLREKSHARCASVWSRERSRPKGRASASAVPEQE